MDMGLIFGVIVSIFVIGLVIAFAYDYISKFLEMQEHAEILRSIEKLTVAVDRVYSTGGETVDTFDLTFPRSAVHKVCFVPAYRGDYPYQKKGRLLTDLRTVIDAKPYEKEQLARLLLAQRIVRNPHGIGEIDKNQTLLLFFTRTAVPWFKHIENLGPSRKTGTIGPILCVGPRDEILLKRHFDSKGAWVDVEMS